MVELAERLATAPVPKPSTVQTDRARARFLQQAASFRTELRETLGEQFVAPKPTSRWDDFVERTREFWRSFLDVPVLRLAPLAAILVAIYVATFLMVNTAEAALPGDLVYPFKQWAREQRITRSDAAERNHVIIESQNQVADELKKVADRGAARAMEPGIDLATLVTEKTDTLVYYGRKNNLLLFGSLLVAPNYQENPNVEDFAPIELKGTLEPGVTVQLTYHILPAGPNVVQGVRAEVIDRPKPTPVLTATPILLPMISGVCQVTISPGWLPYQVKQTDSLSFLAFHSGTSKERIAGANCLSDDTLPEMIYLPERIYVKVTPTDMPPITEPMPTATATPEPPPTMTPLPEPPTTVPQEPDITPIVVPTSTEVSPGGVDGNPTATPTDTPATGGGGIVTPEPTSQPTGTVAPTETAPAGGDTATPVATDTGTPSDTSTPAPTDTGTPAGGDTSTPTAAPTDTSVAPTDVPVTPTEVPVVPTEPPVIPTEPPTIPTEPPTIPTEPPTIPTEPPVIPTEPPVILTEPPTIPTEPPVIPIEPPTIPTEPPVIPTDVFVEPSNPPVVPTDPPAVPTDPPASAPTIAEPVGRGSVSPSDIVVTDDTWGAGFDQYAP